MRWLAERSRSEFLRAARLVVKARTSDMFADSSGGGLSKDQKDFLKKRKAPGVKAKVSLGSRSHTCNRGDHKILSTWVGAVERVIRMSGQVPVLQKTSQPVGVSKSNRGCFCERMKANRDTVLAVTW